jgi:hypothetical protein
MTPLNTFLGTGSGGSGTSASPTTVQAVQQLPSSFPSVGGAIASQAATSVGSLITSPLFSSRLVAIVLGLLFIAGAIIVYVGEDVADALGVGSKKSIVRKGVELAAGA